MDLNEKKRLEDAANDIRCAVIDMIGHLGVGHIGGALSICDILASLYWREMKVDAKDPRMPGRDRLVLSKGHAGPALYATLALKGFFPKEWLYTLNVGGTRLPSHCDRTKTPGIDMTAGSLGQGLSAAVGIALGCRLDRRDNNVFCILGDGESQEGQVWEAAMFAAHKRLSRLIAFTDCNKMQIDGTTDEVCSLGDIEGKWRSFDWNVVRIDGHNVEAICDAVESAKHQSERPTMIIADTIKGKGGNFCEGQVSSHNMKFGADIAEKAIVALKAAK